VTTTLLACSKPFSRTKEIEYCFKQLPYCEGWMMGSCHVQHPARSCSAYEVFDREHTSHWLFAGSWLEWDRVMRLWSQLTFVSKTIQSISPVFAAYEPILPDMKWVACGNRFIGLTKKRSTTPYMSMLSQDKPPRFEHLVQLTGFLRLFQHQTKHLVFVNRDIKTIDILDGAHDLVAAVKKYIPKLQVFCEWETFYLKNTYDIAASRSTDLSLSFGSYVTSCLAYSEQGALLIDYPFFLEVNIEDVDLCEILYAFLDFSAFDRQYLIDLYYNMEVPSHFFSLLAYHHMTKILEVIADDDIGACERSVMLEQLKKMARSYNLFRAQVPSWYV
jgi:hypothetical protein